MDKVGDCLLALWKTIEVNNKNYKGTKVTRNVESKQQQCSFKWGWPNMKNNRSKQQKRLQKIIHIT